MVAFRRVDPALFKLFPVEEGKETSCVIPLPETMKVEVYIRSPAPVSLFWIDADGVSTLLTSGSDVSYKGKLDTGGVEIVASTSFWYLCHQSRWFEFVDPVPMQVELVQTQKDVLRSMIDERLAAYRVKHEMDRELSEDEKDELILDIVHGDLEFDDAPDEFGLGYEERLAEFVRRTAEQSSEAEEDGASARSSVAEKPAEEAGNSSST